MMVKHDGFAILEHTGLKKYVFCLKKKQPKSDKIRQKIWYMRKISGCGFGINQNHFSAENEKWKKWKKRIIQGYLYLQEYRIVQEHQKSLGLFPQQISTFPEASAGSSTGNFSGCHEGGPTSPLFGRHPA